MNVAEPFGVNVFIEVVSRFYTRVGFRNVELLCLLFCSVAAALMLRHRSFAMSSSVRHDAVSFVLARAHNLI